MRILGKLLPLSGKTPIAAWTRVEVVCLERGGGIQEILKV